MITGGVVAGVSMKVSLAVLVMIAVLVGCARMFKAFRRYDGH